MYRLSKQQFLVGMNSDLCGYLCRLIPLHREPVNYLCAANDTTTPRYGWLDLSINLGLHWNFMVVDVTHPLIGMDLSHFSLLVECRNDRLLDGVTSGPAQGTISVIPSMKTITGCTPVNSLIAEFPDLTCPAGVHHEVRHNTVHHISTVPDSPVMSWPQ
jgi:hypothetical protein